MTDYTVFGIAPGAEFEQVLLSPSTDKARALASIVILERDHGCTACRIETFYGDGRELIGLTAITA
jgi:hypothetical protein